MKKTRLIYQLFMLLMIPLGGEAQVNENTNADLKLWYSSPAQKWSDAFPLGNGRIAAMSYGRTDSERFQINDESLWAGCTTNPYANDFHKNLVKIQKMVLAKDYSNAHDFGLENLTASPTSFRSYEPLADLTIDFGNRGAITNYRRELDLSTGICTVSYSDGGTQIVQESFISAVDDVLCIRISSENKNLNCSIGLNRFKDADIIALPEGKLNMDGQIIDIEDPETDDNPGGSGPGGKHMRFAGRLESRVSGGHAINGNGDLVIESANEIILLFTSATDYNLSLLNFDSSIDPGTKAEQILDKIKNKTWSQLKSDHLREHKAMFNRVSLDLGPSVNDSLPTDERIKAFQNEANDNGLVVQMFQFGRYLLMGSSREPAILPANLQGKWSEREWAPWEADYHLNVNLQMNYWPADVSNLAETIEPLVNWMERVAEISRPLAKKMYNSNGWFSGHANNPFGRVTPSASTIQSQFVNGVLDPLAGAWMLMNLWDHYEFSQDQIFLEEKLYPLLKGSSEFITDVLIPDSEGKLHFIPSASPENLYIDDVTGRNLRITSTSTYHLSIIKAVFKATKEAAEILNIEDEVGEKITESEKLLPTFSVDKEGRLMEWRYDLKEHEPGHRHLSHLLGVHPFSLITSESPELFNAAHQSLEWRQKNGQGSGGGWSAAHTILMQARFLEGDKAYAGLKRILLSKDISNMLNAGRIFQIDANFGATAGRAEMLIQSHNKDKKGNFILHLLPALPLDWSTGSVKGLCTRGGFEIDMDWDQGNLASARIFSKNGGSCKINYKHQFVDITLKPGEKRTLPLF